MDRNEYIRRQVIKKTFKAAGLEITDAQVDLVDFIANNLKRINYQPSERAVKQASADTDWVKLGEMWLEDARLNGY